MISFGSYDADLIQFNLPTNTNYPYPIIFSIPSISFTNTNFAIPCSFAMDINNPCCCAPSFQVVNNNNPLVTFDSNKQMRDNLIKKMQTINSKSNLNHQKEKMLDMIIKNTTQNSDNNSFISKSKRKNMRVHFTEEEDERIKDLVNVFGTKNWSIIASLMERRTAKQCRDRYSNYLIPGFFQGEWSNEEDQLLKKLYNENGSKWSLIQNYFPNRSSNSIKNRWYNFLRKNETDPNNNNDDEKRNKDENSKTTENMDQINFVINLDEFEMANLEEEEKFEIPQSTNDDAFSNSIEKNPIKYSKNTDDVELKEETNHIFDLDNDFLSNKDETAKIFLDDEWITFN